MPNHARNRAVVVGGSMAGLLAARALSDHFAEVLVIERDQIPASPEVRKGVPQGAHLHNLIHRGRRILEDFFPGFVDDMAGRGSALVDMCRLSSRYTGRGWLARMQTGEYTLAQRRPVLEHAVRERVGGLPNCSFIDGTVMGLRGDVAGRVVGVTVAPRGLQQRDEIDADLVVEAGGRGSQIVKWLGQLGYEAPLEETVQSFVGYASRLVRVPEDAWPGDMRAINALPTPGSATRGAVLFPADDGLHMLTVSGQNADFPPRAEEEVMEFLKSSIARVIYDIVEKSEPVTPFVTTRTGSSRRRRFDQLDRRPPGLVVLGDAFCCFNPIYGQGMSTAAVAASILSAELARTPDNDEVVAAFPALLAAETDYAWRLSTAIDAGYPKAEIENLEPTPEILELMKWFAKVQDAATDDPVLAAAMVESQGMMTPDPIRSDEVARRVEAWLASGGEVTNSDPMRPPASEIPVLIDGIGSEAVVSA